jgi:RimJ/RimL family protein N-acetyltransferase
MGTKFKSLQPLVPAMDVDKAALFYQNILGFKLAWKDGTPATLAIVYRGDVEIFLAQDLNAEHAEAASIRISVENIEDLYVEYKAYDLIHPNGALRTMPWGLKEFTIRDLNGVCIAFHELPKAKKEGAVNPNVVLETERLRLLPLQSEHFQALHAIYSNPVTMKNWHTLPHATLAETEKLLNEYMLTNSSWALEDKETKKIIGLVNCFSVEMSKSTGMGYILASEFQNKGLATEAANKALEHLFSVWNLPYIELWIFDDNLASVALAQKLGFRLENTFNRSGPDGETQKETGIFWLKQNEWWTKQLSNN